MQQTETESSRAPDNGMRALLGDDAYEQLYSPQTGMALALGRVKHQSQVYGGTVPEHTVQRRRVKNRVARHSRRLNRLRNHRHGVR